MPYIDSWLDEPPVVNDGGVIANACVDNVNRAVRGGEAVVPGDAVGVLDGELIDGKEIDLENGVEVDPDYGMNRPFDPVVDGRNFGRNDEDYNNDHIEARKLHDTTLHL